MAKQGTAFADLGFKMKGINDYSVEQLTILVYARGGVDNVM